MKLELIRELLQHQYEAALATLAHCLKACPDASWDAPVAKYPFSQSAFHTLFFADYYLEPEADSFPSQAFHHEHPSLFGDYEQLRDVEPTSVYTREQLAMYLRFVTEKVARSLDAETDESLAAPAKFPRKAFTRAELHVYNIRHVQHHAAQLILKLRVDAQASIPWYRSGWEDRFLG
ncbi:MAG: DinB family protein [Planctomycetales bacterium]|nr:DinB family protein [Planctomycetales bacterium]